LLFACSGTIAKCRCVHIAVSIAVAIDTYTVKPPSYYSITKIITIIAQDFRLLSLYLDGKKEEEEVDY